jgi:predicted CXXCH cytochrome family protein
MSLSDPSDAVDYGPSVCGSCHTSEIANTTRTYHPYYDEWVNSKHSLSLTAAGGIVATDPSCQGCHVAQIAIAETIEGGTAERPVTDPQPLTCAVCHDPHGSPYQSQLRLDPADLCATCHSGTTVPGEEIRHPQSSMREGTSGIKPTDVPQKDFMADVLCADCHLYSSGPPQNITGHSFGFKPEACADCHTGNPQTFDLSVDQAQTAVNAYRSSTSALRDQVAFDLAIAYSMIDNATRFGFDLAIIDQATEDYEDANYSYGFVTADKSLGAHNPQYAMGLLNFASDRIAEIKDNLQPGHVIGIIKDSEDNAASGVIVRRSGKDLAISGADGSYSFDYASGTYDFTLVKDGEHVGTVSGVSIAGGSTTDAGESVISFSEPFDWTLPLLAIIILLVVLLIGLFMRSARKKEEGDEPSEEPEDERESPATEVDESQGEKGPEMK